MGLISPPKWPSVNPFSHPLGSKIGRKPMVNPSKWVNLKSNFLKFHHRNQAISGIEKARKMAYFRAFLALLSCRLSLAELRSATSGFEAVFLTLFHSRITIVILEWKSVRNTASKPLVALRSSASDNLQLNNAKKARKYAIFRAFSMPEIAWFRWWNLRKFDFKLTHFDGFTMGLRPIFEPNGWENGFTEGHFGGEISPISLTDFW